MVIVVIGICNLYYLGQISWRILQPTVQFRVDRRWIVNLQNSIISPFFDWAIFGPLICIFVNRNYHGRGECDKIILRI